jgi:hypothetical protein
MTRSDSASTGPYTQSQINALVECYKNKDFISSTIYDKHAMSSGSSLCFDITSTRPLNIKAQVVQSKINVLNLDPTRFNKLLIPTTNLHRLRTHCIGSLVAYCLNGKMANNDTKSLIEFSNYNWHLGIVVHHTWNFTCVMACQYNEQNHTIYPNGREPIILMDRSNTKKNYEDFSMQFLERFPSFDSFGFLKVRFEPISIDDTLCLA